MSSTTWIVPSIRPAAPFVMAYRLHFSSAAAETLRFSASADERYALYLDGERVGQGPERGDGENWFFERYELAVAAGAHTLVALVWTLGPEASPLAQMSVRHGFWLDGGSASSALSTATGEWQCMRVGGLLFRENFTRVPSFYAVGVDLQIDGAAFPWGVRSGTGEGWEPAARVVEPPKRYRITGELEEMHALREAILPPMFQQTLHLGRTRHVETLEPGTDTLLQAVQSARHDAAAGAAWDAMLAGNGAVVIPAGAEVRVIVDLDNYYSAYPILTTMGGAGSIVTLTWEESLYHTARMQRPPDKGNRSEVEGKFFYGISDRFLPDGGAGREFETLWWRAGRYVQFHIVTGREALTISDFRLRETHYPITVRSSFSAADDRFAPLHKLGIRTLEMCAHETYMDCPFYEQLMYVGDTRLEILTHFTLDTDSRLPRKAVELFDRSRDGFGLTASRYPSHVRQLIPTFCLWWVQAVHDFSRWRDDAPFVRERLAGVRTVLECALAHRVRSGLLGLMPGWNFVDWVKGWTTGIPPMGADGTHCAINWQLVLALDAAAELELEFGDAELAARYTRLAGEQTALILQHYWDAEAGVFRDDTDGKYLSQHSQCLAAISGRLPLSHMDALRRTLPALVEEGKAWPVSIYYSHYYLEALRALGLGAQWLAKLEDWFELNNLGFRTTPECGVESRSDCHAWGAHPVYHSYSTLLGIRPGKAGFAEVEIRPLPCALAQLSGKMVHPLGMIEVTLDRSRAGRLAATVTLPPGLAGKFSYGESTVELRPGVTTSLDLPEPGTGASESAGAQTPGEPASASRITDATRVPSTALPSGV